MLVDHRGYWDLLRGLVDHVTASGFLRPQERLSLLTIRCAADLLTVMDTWAPPPPRWAWLEMTTSLRRVAFLRSIEIQQAAPFLEAARRELTVLRASTFTADGLAYANMLITCEHDERAQLSPALERLAADHGLLEPGVLAEIQAVLAQPPRRRPAAPIAQIVPVPSRPVPSRFKEELCLP